MKLSFNSWVYAAFPAWLPLRSLEDTIDTLSEIGFDGIEIGAAAPHGFPDYLDAARRRDLVAHLERRGLEVSALCPALGGGPGYNPVSPDAPEREAGLRYMRACIELASDLSCERVIFLGGYRRLGQTQGDAWRMAVESLSACAEHAARHGVQLVVEPTSADSNLLDHAADCARLIDDAGVDAGIMLDTYHIFHRQDEVRDALRSAGDRLAYVHVSDLNRDAPGTHRHFGSMVRELRELGYDGWLSAEVGFNRREGDPDGLARASFAHLREIVDASVEVG
jgi:fructoselysine 3-epimerase